MTRQKADGEFHRPDGSMVTGAFDGIRQGQLCRKAQDLLPALSRAALPGMEDLSAVETEQNVLLQTARKQENDAKDRVKQTKDLGEAIPDSSSRQDSRWGNQEAISLAAFIV